jgi:hypothetical protein
VVAAEVLEVEWKRRSSWLVVHADLEMRIPLFVFEVPLPFHKSKALEALDNLDDRLAIIVMNVMVTPRVGFFIWDFLWWMFNILFVGIIQEVVVLSFMKLEANALSSLRRSFLLLSDDVRFGALGFWHRNWNGRVRIRSAFPFSRLIRLEEDFRVRPSVWSFGSVGRSQKSDVFGIYARVENGDGEELSRFSLPYYRTKPTPFSLTPFLVRLHLITDKTMRFLSAAVLLLSTTVWVDAFVPLAQRQHQQRIQRPSTSSSWLLMATTPDNKEAEKILRQEIAERNSMVENEEQYAPVSDVLVQEPPSKPAASSKSTLALEEKLKRLTTTRAYPLFLAEKALELVEGFIGANNKQKEDTSFTTGSGSRTKEKIVILGTGWGAAAFLKGIDASQYDVTVISPRNYFLFTPMLAGSSVGTVDFRSITEPIREVRTVTVVVTYYTYIE